MDYVRGATYVLGILIIISGLYFVISASSIIRGSYWNDRYSSWNRLHIENKKKWETGEEVEEMRKCTKSGNVFDFESSLIVPIDNRQYL